MRKTIPVVLCCLQLAVSVSASPIRPLSDIHGATLPHGQWFVPAGVSNPTPHSAGWQFYDNPTWPNEEGPGWGGSADSAAISGYITQYSTLSGKITQFTVQAAITNDTYDWEGPLDGTAATYGTFTAPVIAGQWMEPLFNAHLTANFAGKNSSASSNIYAVDYDELAFQGTSTSEPPVAGANGSFAVPTWTFGDIPPEGSTSRLLTFKFKTPVGPGDPLYEWVTWSYENLMDVFASRTRTVKIPMFPAGPVYDDGSAWPDFAGSYSCNASVFYDEKQSLGMRLGDNTAFGHYWWRGMYRGPTEMMQFRAYAGHAGKVDVSGVTLKASGTGNDKTDISAVTVYLDENESGLIDTGEPLLGAGAYDADDGTCTITFTSPATVPSPTIWGIYFVVAYTLNIGVQPDKTYKFELESVRATIAGTGTGVMTYGLPVASCTKNVIATPGVVTIGQAKKLSLGSLFILQVEPVIGEVGGNTFIEEPNCAAGIAVALSTPEWKRLWVPQDSFVTLVGRIGVQESDGQAFVKDPMIVPQYGFVVPPPVLMSCRSVGGGTFGLQRGTVDRVGFDLVPEKPSMGLNNVGMLVTVCGKVRYATWDAVWIDDGSGLWDGHLDDLGAPVPGLKVALPQGMVYGWLPAPKLNDFIHVTGIVTTQVYLDSPAEPKPLTKVVWPRQESDIVVDMPAM